ncbi:MAG: S9 family peptidase [Bacteroidales bacterium]|nr:S9 family peptidase [Bacteroidales bacterium]
MKTRLLFMSVLLTAAMTSCGGSREQANDAPIIGHSNIKIDNHRMTPEVLWGMGRIGSVTTSEDGEKIAYTVSYYSVEQNKSNTELFIMNIDGSGQKQLTHSATHESAPSFIKNDSKLAYLSSKSGSSQVWEMNLDGSDARQLTNYDGDIEGFQFSPDGKKLLFVAQVKTVQSTADKYPDLPKASGKIITDLMYKHWDEWTTTAPHPFVASFDGNSISDIKDLLEGEPYESPMKPFGGMEQLAWNPSSDKIAYTCRKKTGLAYAISTNSDIYIYDIATAQTVNITEDNLGYDTNPQYSPDGQYIAWLSMERDGYEADQNRLFIMNLASGEKTFLSKAYESNVDDYIWDKESKSIYFLGVWHGEEHIYNVDITSKIGDIAQLTQGQYDFASLALSKDKLIAKRHSMSEGDEIYALSADRNNTLQTTFSQLTFENKPIYDQLEMGKVEPRWMKTVDGKDMLTWVIYPPQFDPKKKYPTLLFCEGGPQSPVSQFWSYRWNFQIMAANDYIIVAPNRRGLPGFGIEWNEEISGDYGGLCMKDYFTAIDNIAREPYVDKDRLGCVGASFGGFSVYWIAGHHEGRFKAFIAHDGIFNMEMQYLETEEKWFANWDMGGAYWERENKIAQRTFANSPHLFVDKWDTPILCIHGEKDYRILPNQAMAAFDAAIMRGVPAELLIYPDENHWVLKPQNGILWQRTFFEWLDKWLKK